tara:strand:- start:42 stop:353 length:312 start_codon:yes stop_codon:yes gene_type:complete
MTAKEYLLDIGFENAHLPELFNNDDKSYYQITELMEEYHQAKLKLLGIGGVSHSTTPSYLNDKYKVVQHVLDTYQVERNGEPVFRGEKEECYQYVKDELGYCG